MTSPGRHAAQDGSFARSAGGAAGRGLVLIVVAVIIGLVLLAKGFDGADPSLAETSAGDSSGEPAADDTTADDTAADDSTGDDGSTGDTVPDDTATGDTVPDDTSGTTAQPTATRAPGEVRVAVVNGVGEGGLAGAKTEALDTQGFVTAAKNSAGPVDVSVVYYVDGYAEDAKVVASALNIPADIIQLGDPAQVLAQVANSDNVNDFHVFVMQGGDRVAG